MAAIYCIKQTSVKSVAARWFLSVGLKIKSLTECCQNTGERTILILSLDMLQKYMEAQRKSIGGMEFHYLSEQTVESADNLIECHWFLLKDY